jgi:hypothetical protein
MSLSAHSTRWKPRRVGAASLLSRIRDSQSRNACLSPSIDGVTILIHVDVLGSESAVGELTSLALTTASFRGRAWAESLFATISRQFSGASLRGPGKATARRSALFQTRIRVCPLSVVRRPDGLHACAAIVIPPFFGISCSSCSQVLSDCCDSAARSVTPHAPIIRASSLCLVDPGKRQSRCTPSLELASKPRRTWMAAAVSAAARLCDVAIRK